jgi:protein-disulfide isomerase/uncharacterized membrane protein
MPWRYNALASGREAAMVKQAEAATTTDNGRRLCIALTALVRSRIDPDYQSFCAVSEGMNCETVALSDYSTVFGGPVSVWATAGYGFIIFLALLALVRRRDGFGRGFLFLFAVGFGLVSLWLIYVMKYKIGSLCILCLGIDAVNLGLLAMAFLAARTPGQTLGGAVKADFSTILRRPWLPGILAVAGIASLAGAYAYGTNLVPPEKKELAAPADGQLLDSPEKWTSKLHGEQCTEECGCEEHGADRPTTQMGTDASGHQWIGAGDAELVIEEFTDYECPYCRQAHMMVRRLLSNHPGRIKVLHRHYPLDQACNRAITRPFHKRACEFSRIAICAGRQGRFWEMNDFLFQHADEIRAKAISAEEIAKRLELNPDDFDCCMADSTVVDAIKADIEEGIAHELKGTPAFIIDGTVYYGKIPDEAVQKLK